MQLNDTERDAFMEAGLLDEQMMLKVAEGGVYSAEGITGQEFLRFWRLDIVDSSFPRDVCGVIQRLRRLGVSYEKFRRCCEASGLPAGWRDEEYQASAAFLIAHLLEDMPLRADGAARPPARSADIELMELLDSGLKASVIPGLREWGYDLEDVRQFATKCGTSDLGRMATVLVDYEVEECLELGLSDIGSIEALMAAEVLPYQYASLVELGLDRPDLFGALVAEVRMRTGGVGSCYGAGSDTICALEGMGIRDYDDVSKHLDDIVQFVLQRAHENKPMQVRGNPYGGGGKAAALWDAEFGE